MEHIILLHSYTSPLLENEVEHIISLHYYTSPPLQNEVEHIISLHYYTSSLLENEVEHIISLHYYTSPPLENEVEHKITLHHYILLIYFYYCENSNKMFCVLYTTSWKEKIYKICIHEKIYCSTKKIHEHEVVSLLLCTVFGFKTTIT